MGKASVIFDFDGTIADTVKTGLGIVNSMAGEFGFKEVDGPTAARLRGKKPLEMIKEVGIPLWKLPRLAVRVQAILKGRIGSLNSFPGMREALKGLKRQGLVLGILTSDTKGNVEEFLKSNKLEFFDFIRSEKSLFGKGPALKKLIAEYGLDPKYTVYVGDEVRDVEAARRAGTKSAAVCWGVNSQEILRAMKPDALAVSPLALKQLLPALLKK